MNKQLASFAVLCALVFISSCKKDEGELRDQFLGTWRIDKLIIQSWEADTLYSDTSIVNLGSMTFYEDTRDDVFHPVVFPSAMRIFGPFGYLEGKSAVYYLSGDRMECWWNPDIQESRLFFWGTGPGASYTAPATIRNFSDNSIQLLYISQNGVSRSEQILFLSK